MKFFHLNVQQCNCILIMNKFSQGSVYVPSFDHGVGDPIEDDIFVGLQ